MRRYQCFDGLRGILALYVVLYHAMPLAQPYVPGIVYAALGHGTAAVDVFFMLSGFVILRSLEAYGWQSRPFLLARIARIYPAYLLALLLAACALTIAPALAGPNAAALHTPLWPANAAAHLAAHLTMSHGLFPEATLPYVVYSILGAAWSLSTEFQFYVLLCPLALLLGDRTRDLTIALVVLAVAGTVYAAFAPPADRFSIGFLPNRAMFFALGLASSSLSRGATRTRALKMGALAAAIVPYIGLTDGWTKAVTPLVWIAVLAIQFGDGRVVRVCASWLCSKPLLWLGGVSYPLYLVHQPVQNLLAASIARPLLAHQALATSVWLGGATMLPCLLAWVLHTSIELPGAAWGHRTARDMCQARLVTMKGRMAPLPLGGQTS